MIFPFALYYLVVLPLFHFGDGAETTPLTFVVAFLAVFAASAWVECHVIGDLPRGWFVAKLAFVVAAAAALLFSIATAAQLQDVALAVFALESVSALVTAFAHVIVEYQQVFVVDDELPTMSAEAVTFASPPVVIPVISHHAVTSTMSQAAHSTATSVSSPPAPELPEIPFDAERFLMRVQLQYQLEAEAAKQRIHSLLDGIYVERVQNHLTPVSFPVTTAPPAVTDQPQATATTIAPPSPTPSSPPPTPATPSPAAATMSPSCATPTSTEDILPVDTPVAQLVVEDSTASTEPFVAQLSLTELVSDDAGHDALDLLPTQPKEPSLESQDPASPTLSIDSPTARPRRRNVRHVKSKRERTCPTPPATYYTTRSGRSVRPPDRFGVRVQSTCVNASCYTTRSGRRVQPPRRFTVEDFGSGRH